MWHKQEPLWHTTMIIWTCLLLELPPLRALWVVSFWSPPCAGYDVLPQVSPVFSPYICQPVHFCTFYCHLTHSTPIPHFSQPLWTSPSLFSSYLHLACQFATTLLLPPVLWSFDFNHFCTHCYKNYSQCSFNLSAQPPNFVWRLWRYKSFNGFWTVEYWSGDISKSIDHRRAIFLPIIVLLRAFRTAPRSPRPAIAFSINNLIIALYLISTSFYAAESSLHISAPFCVVKHAFWIYFSSSFHLQHLFATITLHSSSALSSLVTSHCEL